MTLLKKGSYPFFSTVALLLLLLLMAMFAAASTASAQTTGHDPRWRAWLGCWLSSPPLAVRASEMVCIVPAAAPSAVDVVTLKDEKVVSRERIDASGVRRDSTRDNCPGWERAQWSSDGRRVYLESEFQCTGASKRSSSGLMAMSPIREWLDVMSVTMGEATGARVLRHAAASVPETLPAEIVSPLKSIPTAAIEDARALAVAPLGTADVIDAAAHVHGTAVEAWLGELRQQFHMDARRLVEFSKAHVPDRVIDLLVALSYPNAFSIAPSPTTLGALAENEGRGRREPAFGAFDDPFQCGYSYSIYGWGGCSPFAYYPYGFLPYADFPYSYSRFGPYGNWGGYGGWYVTEPTVIVLQPGGSGGATHGQVVNGRGYTTGRSDGGSTASSGSSGSSAGNSSAGSSGGGGSSSGGGSGGGGSDGGRTAEPR